MLAEASVLTQLSRMIRANPHSPPPIHIKVTEVAQPFASKAVLLIMGYDEGDTG